MPACNLIIDSCCDLPFDVVDREGIELIEFPYIAGDGEYSDDMYRSRSAHDFFDSMRNGDEPSTAQVPITVYQDVFTRAIESGVPTVCLSFSSGLSGSYNTAMIIRDQLVAEHPEAELYVVDTLLASIAEGFLVYEAIRQRDRGLTAKEMVDWAEEARYYIDAEFMVDDLEALRRGGRIPASVALAGIEARREAAAQHRARWQAFAHRRRARAEEGHQAACGVLHKACLGRRGCALRRYRQRRLPEGCDRLKEALSKIDENILFLESSIGPVIGSHVGPGMLAVVFWGKDRREELSVADRIARKVKGN